MHVLRFITKFKGWTKNTLFVEKEMKPDEEFPLTEGELVSVRLQFLHIEPGPWLYEDVMSEAAWIAELFPDGEYIEERATMLTRIRRISDNSIHTFETPIGETMLVAYRSIEDGAD